jgi:nucleoside-diphosphate kinase
MALERTFLMIKPDGVSRGLVGEIVQRIERKGYRIAAMKMFVMTPEKAKEHYAEHRNKPFFGDLVSFITSGPVIAMVLEGEKAVEGIRAMMGRTDPKDSPLGTIRGDLAINLSRNVVHGSDSLESAKREISIFFHEGELNDHARSDEEWLYPNNRKESR